MTVAKIQNNEFPGFYSAIAQINHPVWKADGVANLIRHYAEEVADAVGSFVVYNSVDKIYERVILIKQIYSHDSSCQLSVYRPGVKRNPATLLGRVSLKLRTKDHYGPELPDWRSNILPHTWVLNVNSYDRVLQGLGTQLIQAADELYSKSQGRMMLCSDHNPQPAPFYYKLEMRWAERPNRVYDRKLYEKACAHMENVWKHGAAEDVELEAFYKKVERAKTLPDVDYDEVIRLEIEAARREKREPNVTCLVPDQIEFYFPDTAIKMRQKVIQERPVLYTTQDTHDSCKNTKQ